MANQPMFSGTMAWASNFYTQDGGFYVPALQAHSASGEHGFNALKTLDPFERGHVLAADSPRDSKARGRKVTLRPGWDAGVRVAAMAHVLKHKFADPTMASLLLSTKHQMLVETNHWHDQFWGDCYCPRHANTAGTNMLGQLLMALRSQKQGL